MLYDMLYRRCQEERESCEKYTLHNALHKTMLNTVHNAAQHALQHRVLVMMVTAVAMNRESNEKCTAATPPSCS